MQRLDKILSDAGVASRRELKEMIRKGRVLVDGIPARSPEEKLDETSVKLSVDGVPVRLNRTVLLMLHKPAGYVTSTDDPRDKTVMELIPGEYLRLDVKPIGRLDKDTEGLLLFTNDGALAHRLLSPKTKVYKTYFARHEGTTGPADVEAFAAGLTLRDGTVCLPAVLEPQGEGASLVRICEGKYHQIRRMLASRGCPVTYLKRLSEGEIQLGDLPVGEVKEVDIPQI